MPRRNSPADTPESHAAIIEMVDAIDQWHKDAHSRLRKEVDALLVTQESNYKYLRDRSEANASHIETLAHDLVHTTTTPISLDKIMVTPRVMGVLFGWFIATIIAVVTSIYAMTSNWRADMAAQRTDQVALRSEVREVRTLIDAAKIAAEARANVSDIQNKAQQTRSDDIARRLELTQYDIQNLKDLVIGRKKP